MRIIYAAILGAMIAAPAQAVEAIVKTDYLACNSERLFDRADRIRKSGNEKALKAFTTGAVLSQSCVSLKSGDSVFTEGHGKGSGTIKIRPKGAFKTFFTSELAFQ